MNMTDNDKELALRILSEFDLTNTGYLHRTRIADFAHRYHTAKLEQAASGFYEWMLSSAHPMFAGDESEAREIAAHQGWEAGAASQQPAIAALAEEVERLNSLVTALQRPDPGDEKAKGVCSECKAIGASYSVGIEPIKKQLQSAQRAIKAKDDALGKLGAASALTTSEREVIIEQALATQADAPAADEPLARVNNQHGVVVGAMCAIEGRCLSGEYHDQLTAARSALVEAREALRNSEPIMKHYQEPVERHKRAIATITTLLGL